MDWYPRFHETAAQREPDYANGPRRTRVQKEEREWGARTFAIVRHQGNAPYVWLPRIPKALASVILVTRSYTENEQVEKKRILVSNESLPPILRQVSKVRSGVNIFTSRLPASGRGCVKTLGTFAN
jgi:hypothetical protein